MDRWNLAQQLISDEDRANAQYITGEIDRDTWTRLLEDIDSRLSVIGLRLAFRPWEGHVAVPATANSAQRF